MKKKFLNILPFILTSILVIGFWKMWTGTDNYAWNPIGKEILMLDIALTTIFIYKTIFGVNYYLSGLHSYAAGDPVPIPTFVYYTVAVVAFISLLAYLNNRRIIKIKA